jgi:hypothetical protein
MLFGLPSCLLKVMFVLNLKVIAMKTKLLLFFQLLVITGISFSQSVPVESLYLGKTPPENIPEIFFPDAGERVAISSDGTEFFLLHLVLVL